MIINYTGIGCNNTGKHTENEFLNIMNKELTFKKWSKIYALIPKELNCQLKFKDWILPDDLIFFTINDLIEYSGARIEV
jgi:hypothetical protein